MDRRHFLRSLGAAACAFAAPRLRAQPAPPGGWRTFEITTHVHVQNASGVTRVWLPTPLAVAPYQKTLGDTYNVDAGTVSMVERDEIDVLAAEWPAGAEPVVTLTSRVATIDYAVDLATPAVPPPRDLSSFRRYLTVTPTASAEDLKKTVAAVAHGAGTDLDSARALYDWVAVGENHPKDTDANAYYVSLARAAGIPARAVYGLRLERADATRAQHVRAEVYLVGYGWVPVDLHAQTRFGSWTRQWMAYNTAQDVVLPGTTRGALAYVMHPQGETGHTRIDSLNPEAFRYEITARSTKVSSSLPRPRPPIHQPSRSQSRRPLS